MRSLRQVLGRPEAAVTPEQDVTRSWNTLSTIGAGPVADVDDHGVVFPRGRSLAVEIWIGIGDRWIVGNDASVRQTRVVGLPIVETRQRVGDADIVQTAWADEPGDAQGRVVLQLSNETDVAVVIAVVVRPGRLIGEGAIREVRVADSLVIADKRPIVDLGRSAGDVVVASGPTALAERIRASGDELVGDGTLVVDDGSASIAAMIPLTPGVDRQIQVIDGREASSVAVAPLEHIVNGWRTHIDLATEFELPSWPKHVPPALTSSLIGAIADPEPPLGDGEWQPVDDALIASALGGVGLFWAASAIVDRLLDAVTEGSIVRSDWPAVAAATGAIVGSADGDRVLGRHADASVLVAGEVLSRASTPGLNASLVEVVRVVHGDDAAADAAAIDGRPPNTAALDQLGRHGVALDANALDSLAAGLDDRPKPQDPFDLSLSMISRRRPADAAIAARALAGSTWRWGRAGSGDSPHARAAILLGLRSLCASVVGPRVDLVPAMTSAWLGQNLRVNRLPISGGAISFAIRWHGPRAALLWEIDADDGAGFDLTCAALDPTFRTTETAGEALLAEPSHLVAR